MLHSEKKIRALPDKKINILTLYFIKLYKRKKGKDIRKDNRAVQKLRREVEKAKRSLSSGHQTRIEIESLYDQADFSETLTRAKFELFDQNLHLPNGCHHLLKQLQTRRCQWSTRRHQKFHHQGQKLFIDFQRHFICEQDDIIYIYIISIKMAKCVAGKISGVLNRK
jgi:hypothetical protein